MSIEQLIVINNTTVEIDVSSLLPKNPVPSFVKKKIMGSGGSKVHGEKVCVKGDETKVLKPHQYFTPSSPVPGSGIFKIKALKDNQLTKKTKDNNLAIITKGIKMDIEYSVNGKAFIVLPSGKQDDPNSKYSGAGQFTELKNTNVYAG